VQASEADGARGAGTPQQVVDALTAPRHLWLMVPAAYVGSTIDAFAPLLSAGDTLIDGGNSWYRDDIDRAGPLRERGMNYLDVGTSGGVFGLDRGYCLMVGGPDDAVAEMSPIFERYSRPGCNRAHTGYTGDEAAERVAALRPQRCRPLRQDGAQRHRIRSDVRSPGLNILSEANSG
jgi:6-phosphogluconate dehydrogenase